MNRTAQYDGKTWHNISQRQYENGGSSSGPAVAFWIIRDNGYVTMEPGCDASDYQVEMIDGYHFTDERIDADYPDSAAFHAERVVASYSNPKDDKRREACGALVNDPS